MQERDLKGKEAHQLTIDDLKHIRAKLDERSHAHCLAKWFQVTLNLHNGRSASCCLQPSKMIDVTRLGDEPETLHNGAAHIEDRLRMRNGEKIDACGVCWDSEADGNFSERDFKSGDAWAWEKLNLADGDAENVTPSYVEVSFSHQCQLRCSYCNPETSSSIASEIAKHGPYPDRVTEMAYVDRLRKGTLPWAEKYPDSENPYIKAFWHWLPSIYSELKVLRLTGGEPFLSEDTFRFISYVKDNPNPAMDLQFNSNLSFPVQVFERFMREFKLVPEGNYKRVTFFASLDAWGERAEYIRFGLRVETLMGNIERLLNDFPKLELRITATISLLAVYGVKELLEQVVKLKSKYGHERVILSIYPLVFPAFQSVRLASETAQGELQVALAYALSHKSQFHTRELEMLSSLVNSSKHSFGKEIRLKHLADFYRFFSEYDRRKQTHFLSTFPEYRELWQEASGAHASEISQWLDNVTSDNADMAVKACRELMRVNSSELEYQLSLAKRLGTKDPLSLEFLCLPLRLHLKVVNELEKALVRPDRAADIVTLLIRRDSTLRALEESLVRVIKNATAENLWPVIPVWLQSAIALAIDPTTWNQMIGRLVNVATELSWPELGERLLAILVTGAFECRQTSFGEVALIFSGGAKHTDWQNLFTKDGLVVLPKLALEKIPSQREAAAKGVIRALKDTALTDVMLEALVHSMGPKTQSELLEWFKLCDAKRFYDAARIALTCDLKKQLIDIIHERLDIGASVFEQLRLARFYFPANILVHWLKDSARVPWEWLKSAIELTDKVVFAQLVDAELTQLSFTKQDEKSKFWYEILCELSIEDIVTFSVHAVHRKSENCDFSSWWHALFYASNDEDVWHLKKFKPQGSGHTLVRDLGLLADAAKIEVAHELLVHGKIDDLVWRKWGSKARWELLERCLTKPATLPLLAKLTLEFESDLDWIGRISSELLKIEGSFEYISSKPWAGPALEVWSKWARPQDVLAGLPELNESLRYDALRFHHNKNWTESSWSSLLDFDPTLALFYANQVGGNQSLTQVLKRQEDRGAWGFLRDLDGKHRNWMLQAFKEIAYALDQSTAEDAWSWLAINEADACAQLLRTRLPSAAVRWSMLTTLSNDSQIPWACELILVEEDEKRRGVLAEWLIIQDFVILDRDQRWLSSDEAKRVYISKTNLKQLLSNLEYVDFRALELWLQQQKRVNADELLAWYQLDTKTWTYIYNNCQVSVEWESAFSRLPLDSAIQFLRGLEKPGHLISHINSYGEALVTHGEWLVQFPESAVVFARAIEDKSIGDFCFDKWLVHAPLAADMAFSSLWLRFSGSFDDDYLSANISKVLVHLSDDILGKLVVPGRDERSEACFKLLMEQAKRNSAAVQLLQKWWHGSDRPVDILYAAANSGLCKSDLIGKWAVIQLGEAIDQENSIAWNLVDVLIEHKAERSSLLKLGSSLLSSSQLKSPPGMKLIAYASGKINNVSDF